MANLSKTTENQCKQTLFYLLLSSSI